MSKKPRLSVEKRLRLPQWHTVHPTTILNNLKREWLLIGAELLIVLLATLMFAKPYLNLDTCIIPDATRGGNEFLTVIPSHHFWKQLEQCGWCSLWDGSIQGGIPALANPYTSMLHPIVALPTLIWDVRNASKIAIVLAFAMGGLAQWWIAYTLGLGRIVRIWSGLMGIVAGYLSGNMYQGFVGLVVSTAACALILPPLIAVSRSEDKRFVVILALTFALAGISGQGYMQVGMLATIPALIFLVVPNKQNISTILRRYLLAAIIALFLIGPLLIPMLHFGSQIDKPSLAELKSGQPFTYTLFNFVINDAEFYLNRELKKLPYPFIYVTFIGWVPILLALWSLKNSRNQLEKQAIRYLLAFTFIVLWISSDGPIPILQQHAPEWIAKRVSGLRHFATISRLAVPPILGLAAIGLDKLLHGKPWLIHYSQTEQPSNPLFTFDLRWLLIIPLTTAIISAWSFSSNWIKVDSIPENIYPTLEKLHTSDTQWVQTPPRKHVSLYVEPAIEMGMKLNNAFRPYFWKDRPTPAPVLAAIQDEHEPPDGMIKETTLTFDNTIVHIYVAPPGNEYAAITHSDGDRTVCTAQSRGGFIDVVCDSPKAGTLKVKEFYWSGWSATLNDESVPITSPSPISSESKTNPWLSIEVPAGKHTIRFRYFPWDVPLGVFAMFIGVALAWYVWRNGTKKNPSDNTTPSAHNPSPTGTSHGR